MRKIYNQNQQERWNNKKEDEREVEEYKKEVEPQLTIDDSLDFVVDNISATNKGIDSESMTSILSFDDECSGRKETNSC